MTYRVFVCTAIDGLVQAEIPWDSFQFSLALNGRGSWSVTTGLRNAPLGVELLPATAFDVAKSTVVITSNGVPLFMGFVTQSETSVDASSETAAYGGPCAALGFLGYRRVENYSVSSTEQLTIAQYIVESMAGLFGLGTTLNQTTGASGVTRDRTILLTDRKTCFEALNELAQLENGFDFTSGVTGSQASGFFPTVDVGYPKLLRTAGSLTLGKNVEAIKSTVGDGYANRVVVGGASVGQDILLAQAANVGDIFTYPLIDAIETRSTVIEQATLNAHAQRYLNLYKQPPRIISVRAVASDPDCSVGSFRVGDEFRIAAAYGRLEIDDNYRVLSWSVGVDANGKETLNIELAGTEVAS